MKKWSKEEIKTMIMESDKAVTRAVIAIYNRQTSTEQACERTIEHNNVGFNATDARYLTYCAQWALKTNRLISGRHIKKARKMVCKYAGQLADIANSKTARAEVA